MITRSVRRPVGPVRPARPSELALLRELERVAGEPFREIGMAEVADDEPSSPAELAHFADAGRAWVVPWAGDPEPGGPPRDQPVAYLLAEPVDGGLHVAQVSVHPAAARRRLGAVLIEHAASVAAAEGRPALTLTTYRDVPWNAPYYRRLGFVELAEAEVGPGVRAIREMERAAGLDRWPRVAMRRRPPVRG